MSFPGEGVCYATPSILPLFFSDSTEEQRQAKALCFECPVQIECLEYALRNRERFGIFGGLLPSERKQILKTRSST